MLCVLCGVWCVVRERRRGEAERGKKGRRRRQGGGERERRGERKEREEVVVYS